MQKLTEGKRVLVVLQDPELAAFVGECLQTFTRVPEDTTFVESPKALRAQASHVLSESLPEIMIFGNEYHSGESGIDVLHVMVSGKPLHQLTKTVLFSTEAEREEVQQEYKQYGVEVFLPKPVDPDVLIHTLAPLFQKEEHTDDMAT